MSAPDVESQQSPHARSRRLEVCLLGSVVLLFALVLSGFCAALMFARSLNGSAHEGPSAIWGAPPDMDAHYKSKNFAYLRAKFQNGSLTKGVMDWEAIPYGKGNTLGSGYTYERTQRVLTVNEEGPYFIYVSVNVSCPHICANETLTVIFEVNAVEELSCTLHLPETETVFKKCWTVLSHIQKNSKLLAKVRSDGKLNSRRLEVNSSGFGMFRVDGPSD